MNIHPYNNMCINACRVVNFSEIPAAFVVVCNIKYETTQTVVESSGER